jgi:predicted NBD/HSP70 family sugar kinase
MSKGTAILRQQNEKRTLSLLRIRGTSSRQEIAKALGLSKNTISLIVDKFLKEGIIQEVGIEENGGVGRPRIRLRLVPESYKTIGLLVGSRQCQYVVTDYVSSVLEKGTLAMDFREPVQALEAIGRLCARLLALHPEALGVGVAVPGLVDPEQGLLRFATNLGWRNVRIRETLGSKLNVPVRVMNKVKASALAPAFEMPAGEAGSAFYVSIDEGVGGALLIHGQIYHGASWTAGEIGHICVDPDGPVCSCGQRGCLEALVRLPVLKERLLLAADGAGEDLPFPLVIDRHEGSAAVRETLRAAGEYVGAAMTQVVNLFNPEHIVINSPLHRSDSFRQAVADTLAGRALSIPGETVKLHFIHNELLPAIGAGAAIILDFERE